MTILYVVNVWIKSKGKYSQQGQSMKTDVKQVQSECTNSTKTLNKIEDQMSQVMSMIGDIKRQIGTGIPSNTENNPRKTCHCKDNIPFKVGDEFVSFLNLFQTLNVNLTLIELIEKVPKYTKFLKEIMFRRRKIKASEQVNISASCSAIISR
ncbi:acidic leucine-rich nuclear phosphoprotein 32 family member B-like [Gossypium australe]|uniref:Acidic leucine-rich nuclear phosphoprotein 32 family member B-like n=1 Tax=Gossypium australe TaxID=47621 RepID=A0A5B6VYM3_9ROSI|nr:acidic leucine-rich nuclear phosphoprotein 32 family member B-like [Gossypium australe]